MKRPKNAVVVWLHCGSHLVLLAFRAKFRPLWWLFLTSHPLAYSLFFILWNYQRMTAESGSSRQSTPKRSGVRSAMHAWRGAKWCGSMPLPLHVIQKLGDDDDGDEFCSKLLFIWTNGWCDWKASKKLSENYVCFCRLLLIFANI